MAKVFPFRSLEAELFVDQKESEAGYHDLESHYVESQHASNPLVSRHENYHGQLLEHTPFGSFQGNSSKVCKMLSHDSIMGEHLYALLLNSVKVSDIAHECYATYLSIKSFELDEHKSLLNKHPKEYKLYYSRISNLIDDDFGSSYLQFIVAKAMLSGAFGCNPLISLDPFDLSVNAITDVALFPNHRLDIASTKWGTAFAPRYRAEVNEVVRSLKRQGVLESDFDVDSEKSWTSLPGDLSGKLDNAIMSTLHESTWTIYSNDLKLPVTKHDRSMTLHHSLFERAIELSDERVSLEKRRIEKEPTPEEWEFKRDRERFSSVKIFNETHYDQNSDALPYLPLEQADSILSRSNISTIGNHFDFQEPPTWHLFNFCKGSEDRYRLDSDSLSYLLQYHRPESILNERYNVLDTVLNWTSSLRQFDRAVDIFSDIKGDGDSYSKYSTTFWYMGENLLEFLDSGFFGKRGRLYVCSMVKNNQERMFSKSTKNGRPIVQIGSEYLNRGDVPPRIFVFRGGRSPDYFVRILPGFESYKFAFNRKSTDWGNFEGDELSYVKTRVPKVVTSVLRCWKFY